MKKLVVDLWYYKHCNAIAKITDIKCGLLSKHFFQRTQQHSALTKRMGKD